MIMVIILFINHNYTYTKKQNYKSDDVVLMPTTGKSRSPRRVTVPDSRAAEGERVKGGGGW